MAVAVTGRGEGAVAIPIAFAVTASVEAVVLGAVLWTKVRKRDSDLMEGTIVARRA